MSVPYFQLRFSRYQAFLYKLNFITTVEQIFSWGISSENELSVRDEEIRSQRLQKLKVDSDNSLLYSIFFFRY